MNCMIIVFFTSKSVDGRGVAPKTFATSLKAISISDSSFYIPRDEYLMTLVKEMAFLLIFFRLCLGDESVD